MGKLKRIIANMDIMEFKEGLYYFIITAYSLGILFVMIFKTELLIDRWFIGGLVAIILYILKQLYDNLKNGKKTDNKSN